MYAYCKQGAKDKIKKQVENHLPSITRQSDVDNAVLAFLQAPASLHLVSHSL
jgi:hypothetical protein